VENSRTSKKIFRFNKRKAFRTFFTITSPVFFVANPNFANRRFGRFPLIFYLSIYLSIYLPLFSSHDHYSGSPILSLYKSGIKAISTEYPEHSWLPWEFATAPGKFWSDLAKLLHRNDSIGECLTRLYLIDTVQLTYGQLANQSWEELDAIVRSRRNAAILAYIQTLGGIDYIQARLTSQDDSYQIGMLEFDSVGKVLTSLPAWLCRTSGKVYN